MDSPAPRIVILDNDQTTGDYDIFFKWLYWLESAYVRDFIDLIPIVTIFIKIFEEKHIFRPGLRPFLQRLAELKQEKKIDYIVIYTNQSEKETCLKDLNGAPITIPFLLELMYNCLANNTIIDLRLTRPPDGGSPQKSFSRVFDALKIKRNASKTLFFDDLIEHCPQTDDIGFSEHGHVKVHDYRVPFDPNLFLKLCRLTVSMAVHKNKSGHTYKKQLMCKDLHLAKSITELLETTYREQMSKPYIQCIAKLGDPRNYGFSKYIERIEKTFNDVEQIEI